MLLTLAYICLWFFSSQDARHLLPVLPIVCHLVARELDGVLRRLSRGRDSGPGWRLGGAPAAALALLLLWPGWRENYLRIARRGPVPTTRAGRERFLADHWPSYPAYVLLNRTHGRHYAVVALHDPFMAYFADGRFMAGEWGPAGRARIEARLGDGQSLYEALRTLGASHFLVKGDPRLPSLPDDEAFRRHFRLLLAGPQVRLFELR
jgi:hypothetical protein